MVRKRKYEKRKTENGKSFKSVFCDLFVVVEWEALCGKDCCSAEHWNGAVAEQSIRQIQNSC